MRPASSRVVTLRISVLLVLGSLLSLNGVASAQAETASKRKLLHKAPVAGSLAVTRAAKHGATPPVTTDTWTGGGGRVSTRVGGNRAAA